MENNAAKRPKPAGQPRDLGCSVTFRVRYYETDMMGITHHSNYLRWFEVARTEYLRQAGMTYRSLEEMGLGCPLTGARCRFLHASRYDDEITVQTWIKVYDGIHLTMAYQVYTEGKLICDGETDHAFIWKGRVAALSRSLPAVHSCMAAARDRDMLHAGSPAGSAVPEPDRT
jgi:acyl-CoA thioester hydrolase